MTISDSPLFPFCWDNISPKFITCTKADQCLCIQATKELTHLPLDKMAAIFQTTFSKTFSWMKMLEFWFNFHWNLFPRVQLTIIQHWFRLWLVACSATSHYLNQCLPSQLTHICCTRGRWVNKWRCPHHCPCCLPLFLSSIWSRTQVQEIDESFFSKVLTEWQKQKKHCGFRKF